MSLLLSLGVNQTLAIQFGIFLTVFVVLKYFLFGPYFKAFNQRAEATVGQAELAERFVAETKAMEEEFAQKAQVANEKFRSVFDQSRAEALREFDNQVAEARARARSLMEEAQQKVSKDLATARTQLGKEIPEVAKIINQKMVGKDEQP